MRKTFKKLAIAVLFITSLFMFLVACNNSTPPTPNEVYHKVTFIQEGQDNIVKEVIDGGTLTDIPTPVAQDGYNIYWDRTDFTNIVEDLTVTAVKEPINVSEYVTITFVQQGQPNIVKQVKKGETLTDIPTPVAEDGYNIYWNKADFYNITTDMTVTAIKELIEVVNFSDFVDFVVDVEDGRDIRVLQLTDIQTLDRNQKRYIDRVNGTHSPDLLNGYEKYIGQVIKAYDPDFIIITGDLIYGEFDDSGYQLKELIRIMDSFKTPWAPVFGNHDNESNMGVDWQCDQLENAEYCLFKQRELTGNGNYSVGITQGGELKRVFYMLDTNGCVLSAKSKVNGHSRSEIGFGNDQIQWYTQSINILKSSFPNVKLSMAFHIQLAVFADAFAKYGYNSATIKNNPIDLDKLSEATAVGDFGYIGRPLKGAWDSDKTVWNGIKALGVDSIFVGHEHCNSASVVYEGVRLTYGQKSSTFDRYNSINNGVVNEANQGDPIMGGTYFNLDEEGAIDDAGLNLYDKNSGYEETQKSTGDPQPASLTERVDSCENYTLIDMDGYKNVLNGGEKMHIKIDETAYSLTFGFKPDTFNGELIFRGFIATENSTDGVKITISKSEIKINNTKVAFAFGNFVYDLTVGFSTLYDGNTTFLFVKIGNELVAWELLETKNRVPGNINIESSGVGDKLTFSATSDQATFVSNEWATGNSKVAATFNYDLKNSVYGENGWYYGAKTENTDWTTKNSALAAEGFWTEDDYLNMSYKPLFYQTVAGATNPSINLGYYSDDFMMSSHAVQNHEANTYFYARLSSGYNANVVDSSRFDFNGLVYTFTDIETGNYFKVKIYSPGGSDAARERSHILISYNGGEYNTPISSGTNSTICAYYFGGRYCDSFGASASQNKYTFNFLNIKYDKAANVIKYNSTLNKSLNLTALGIPAFGNYKVDMEFIGVKAGKTAGLMVYYLNGFELNNVESINVLTSNEKVLYVKANEIKLPSNSKVNVNSIVGVYNPLLGETNDTVNVTVKDASNNPITVTSGKFDANIGEYWVTATLGTNSITFKLKVVNE